MTTRTWAYQRMKDDLVLGVYVDDRIHQSTSLNAAPHEQPFIMYRQTSDVEVIRGDDGDAVRRLGYMIFIHDIPGDYMRIDAAMQALRRLFADIVDQPNNIVRSRWVDQSDDLRDEDMGTIMRFARIEITYRVKEAR